MLTLGYSHLIGILLVVELEVVGLPQDFLIREYILVATTREVVDIALELCLSFLSFLG